MRRVVFAGIVGMLALVAAACNRGEDTPGTTLPDPASTTVTSAAAAPATPATTAAPAATPAATDESAEEAGVTVDGMPTYEVVQRVELPDGEELVIVVEPGDYTAVELQNLVFDIVDRFQPVAAIVVDDPEVVPLALAEELSPEEQEMLEDHTFLELVNGVEVTFRGPYSDLAGLVVGS